MNIPYLIIFCSAQIIGLILILLRKKFRTLPNFILKLIFINIISHYLYYYFFYKGFISEDSNWPFVVVPIAITAPLVVYYYVMSVLYGKLKFTKVSLLHLLPYLLNAFIFVLYFNSTELKSTYLLLAKNILVSLYIIYPVLILKMIGNFYQLKGLSLNLFNYNKKRTLLVKLLCGMMSIHFVILEVKTNLPLFISGVSPTMDIINLFFLMLLGYAISYVIISEPRSLHLSTEKVGLGGFKKYSKSKLTRAAAEQNVLVMNQVMETEKPYLDSELNLAGFSQQCKISSHEISETINGLMNQTFNDYINNYRVEEFKKLAVEEKYKNYTILALAFEAGFKSKATFNAAFKKFTNKTPSQFLKELD
ncbi:helix-turn-helix domain-containing protein [Marinifilum caeruleilacunae]|uniref:AraC family transcriptional regulator n=1 Tax=Marinifilum caeruleilacunae TaxID=2499076 RepID=A0ABX1WR36_9BACT|nr:helix-turn-helix domain-containing protein [Marinifilum caeruleilacunae]NOU58471.1 AraC family transcriptional regulator [Marinifilum caeruleilacunae]